MRTNIKELFKVAQTIDKKSSWQGEDEEEIAGIFSEADGTKALEFFDIKFDNETRSVEYNEKLNFEVCIKIVNKYLEKIEEKAPKDSDYPQEVNDYDNITRPNRGADDGTFDYAGTFVISILELLQAHYEEYLNTFRRKA